MMKFSTFISSRDKYLALKHNDLTKRGGARVDVFLDKIKNGEKFLTSKGLVVLDPNLYSQLNSIMRNPGLRMDMEGTLDDGRAITLAYPSDFFKTPEFGGKGEGFGTAAEDRYLTLFRNEIEKALSNEDSPVLKLRINGRTVEMVGIISTPQRGRRAPKSDFSIVDADGNEVAWLSHKAGSKPTDFQQYGGLSDSAFDNNKDLQKFLTKIKELYPNGFGRGESVYRPVKDRNIIFKSVYGIDYGRSPGHENVDEFHQGNMTLRKKGRVYEIQSSHKGVNGDKLSGSGYDAIYYARYTGDRGANIAGIFINNARIGVFPSAKAARTAKKI